MDPLTYFNIPKVLQLRGILINGSTGKLWKVAGNETVNVAREEVGSLLHGLEPLLIDLVLAGWQVQSIVFSTKDNFADQVLCIDLSNLQYTLSVAADASTTAWEEETGVPWDTGGEDSSPTDTGLFVPESGTFAIGLWLRMLDNYHRDIDSDSYALTLSFPADEAFLAPAPDDERQKCLVIYSEASPTTGDENYSFEFVANELADPLGIVSAVRERVKAVMRPRWLSVDRQPAGLINNLSPDIITEPYTKPSFGTKPEVWGTSVPYPEVLNNKPREYKLWSFCRQVWAAILDNSYDFEHVYQCAVENSFKDLLENNAQLLLLKSAIDLRQRFPKFVEDIRATYLQRYYPLGILDSAGARALNNLQALAGLSWAQILFYMHEIQVVDIMTGVTIKPPATNETLPAFEFRSLTDSFGPDCTGFYFEVGGTRTLQINQAGGQDDTDYWHGYMQERLVGQLDFYTLVSFELLVPDPATDSDSQDAEECVFKLIGEDGYEYRVRRYELEWESGELYLTFTMQGGTTWRFQRERADPHLPEDAFYAGDPALEALLRASQRYPFHPQEVIFLDEVAEHLVETVSRYRYYYNEQQAYRHFIDMYRTSQCSIRHFIDFDYTTDSIGAVNAQFPLVQRYLREGLMTTEFTTATPVVEAGVTNWEALLTYFKDKTEKGYDDTELDRFLKTLLAITDEEIENVDTLRDPGNNTEGDFVYEWRARSGGVSASEGIIGAGGGGILFEVKSSPRNVKLGEEPWYAMYAGTFQSAGVTLGPEITFGTLKGEWAEIHAPQAWLASDFSGNAKLTGITTYAVIGGGYTYTEAGTITFFSDKGVITGANTGASEAYGLMVGIDAMETEVELALVHYFFGDSSGYTPLTIAHHFMAGVVAGRDTHFDSGSHTLRPEGEVAVRRMVAEFRAFFEKPTSTLEIDGFTDPVGSAGYNIGLAYRRAQTVYNFIFVLLGEYLKIPTSQVIVRSFGEYSAIHIGKIEDGQASQEWRRVEVRLSGVLIGTFYAGMIQSTGS